MASDSHAVGTVESFLADRDELVALMVKSRLAVWTRTVLVPMSEVSRVLNDRVELTLTRRTFWALPSMDEEESEEDQVVTKSARRLIARSAQFGPRLSEAGDTVVSVAQSGRRRVSDLVRRGQGPGTESDE